MAFTDLPAGKSSVPKDVHYRQGNGTFIVNWDTSSNTRVLQLPGNLLVYLIGELATIFFF